MSRLFAAEAFVAVVDEGSFTAAARRLGVTKSYASKLVAQLEERLGVRLLHRTTRKMSLTEAGRAYHERCAEVMRVMEEAETEAAQLQGTPRGRLRVTLPTTFCEPDLLRPITAFKARHPELTLETFFTDRHVDLLGEGFDLAIRIGEVRDAGLIARRLAGAERAVCASPAYLERRGEPVEPEDLSRHECLIYAYHAQPGTWRLQGPRGEVAVEVSGTVVTNHAYMLVESARQGLGLVFAPVIYTAAYLREGQLRRVLPAWGWPTAVHAVYPGGRHPPLKVRLFVDFLVEHFRSPPWAKAADG
jgi:DNA-binding transcriptional LysR family regulator